MRKTDCLKCEYLNKIDKQYPINIGIELRCRKHPKHDIIEIFEEDKLIKRIHMEIAYAPPLWCPINRYEMMNLMCAKS